MNSLDLYRDACQAEATAHQAWLEGKQTVLNLKRGRDILELSYIIDDIDVAGYIAQGSNDQARKDRRAYKLSSLLGTWDNDLIRAQQEVDRLEVAYESARHEVTYWRLMAESEIGKVREEAF